MVFSIKHRRRHTRYDARMNISKKGYSLGHYTVFMHHPIFTGWSQLFLLHTSLPSPSHCSTCPTCRLINYVSTLTTCFGWIVHTEHSSTHPIHLLVSYPNECSPFGRPFSFSSQRLFISILSFASNIFRTINSKHTHLLFGFGWLHFRQRPRPLNSTVNTFNVDFYWCSTFRTNEDTDTQTSSRTDIHLCIQMMVDGCSSTSFEN